MRPTLRSQATSLLLVWAIPVACIAVAAGLGLRQPALLLWYQMLGVACCVAALVLLLITRRRLPQAGQPISEPAYQGYLGELAMVGALGLDGLILLFNAPDSTETALQSVAIFVVWTLVWVPRWTRRLTTRSSAVVNRDPATVFAFITDGTNEPRYLAPVESVEKLTAGPIRSGTQFRGRVRLGRWPEEHISEIVDYEPNTRMASRIVDTLRPNFDLLTFEPVQGGTLVKHRFDSELPYNTALLGSSAFRWFLKRRILAVRMQGWATVKQILETPEPISPTP